MKKRPIILILILSLLLSGCGAAGVEPPAETPLPAAETPVPTPEATPEASAAPVIEVDPLDEVRGMLRAGRYDRAQDILALLGQDEETDALRLRAALGDPKVGDRIRFGRYEQDDVADDGAEEIEWVVLARDGDQILLLTVNAIDSMPYHDVHYGSTTWAECAMRRWLNGEFIETAFNGAEQRLLAESTLHTPENDYYHTPGGEDTVDRVFLLSDEEVKEYLIGSDYLLAVLTKYAISRGATHSGGNRAFWWLRNAGIHAYDACYISNTGILSYYGYIVSRPQWAVRPALRLELSV